MPLRQVLTDPTVLRAQGVMDIGQTERGGYMVYLSIPMLFPIPIQTVVLTDYKIHVCVYSHCSVYSGISS